MTQLLYELDQITATEIFIDGTKIEAAANKYTFVWKKSVTKHQAKFLRKPHCSSEISSTDMDSNLCGRSKSGKNMSRNC